ncbi:MAG: hypothetical protein ABJZ55_25500 [Fuerstiella sp.]
MNKRQVISVSCVAAIPAAVLLAFLIMNALNNGGNMSGVMGTFVAISALLALLVGIAPFLMMIWYPVDGFATAMPAMEAPAAAPETDEDDDGFEADGFDDEFDDGEMSDDYEDDDSFSDDEYEDFEDEDDEWK